MSVEIKVPSLGESISEATISAILVQNGSSVTQDQEIVEIETEKVNQVLFAPQAGVLNLSIKEGDTVTIGQVIGSVEAGAGAPKEAPPKPNTPEESAAKEQAPQAVPSKEERAPAPKKEASPPKEERSENEPAVFDDIRKSPESFVQELRAPVTPRSSSPEIQNPLTESGPASTNAREERKRMPKIRQTIAKRLVEAKQTMALLTTFNEVDMSAVLEMRKKYKESFEKEHGVRLGFMSFFIKAAVKALQDFPLVNSYIDGNDLVTRKYVDINVAISSDRGLVVPVVANCDQLSFAEIEKTISELAQKARDNKLSMEEMRAGGFTISNGGVFGSTFSTPIVNPPQSAILGMHRIVERPYVVNGKIEIRPIMILALTYDHRIVDGKEGVSFLAQIAKAIQDPACLLIDL